MTEVLVLVLVLDPQVLVLVLVTEVLVNITGVITESLRRSSRIYKKRSSRPNVAKYSWLSLAVTVSAPGQL